ncbi:zinc finger matrin-type protein 5-like [Lineus longissimus]|uniref:zinc finger matrin-type protein 5-like n=1 Tax=Lineus longissimus TaxID=88925 RepID=UPI002B4E39D9
MGKRYYCEFCDKSFADNRTNRKNHLNGSIHHRLRKQHYDAFKDATTILAEEALKKPCKHFLGGYCEFGESCRFSHMTEDIRRKLLQQGANASLSQEAAKPLCRSFASTGKCVYGNRCRFSHLTEEEKAELLQAGAQTSFTSKRKTLMSLKAPKLGDWLAKREKRLKRDTSDGGGEAEDDLPEYTLPPALQGIPDLPPSLIPPSQEDLRTAPSIGWG